MLYNLLSLHTYDNVIQQYIPSVLLYNPPVLLSCVISQSSPILSQGWWCPHWQSCWGVLSGIWPHTSGDKIYQGRTASAFENLCFISKGHMQKTKPISQKSPKIFKLKDRCLEKFTWIKHTESVPKAYQRHTDDQSSQFRFCFKRVEYRDWLLVLTKIHR